MSLEDKLKVMAERGGTLNEREVARKKLEALRAKKHEKKSSGYMYLDKMSLKDLAEYLKQAARMSDTDWLDMDRRYRRSD